MIDWRKVTAKEPATDGWPLLLWRDGNLARGYRLEGRGFVALVAGGELIELDPPPTHWAAVNPPGAKQAERDLYHEALREIAYHGTDKPAALHGLSDGVWYRRIAFSAIGIAARALSGGVKCDLVKGGDE